MMRLASRSLFASEELCSASATYHHAWREQLSDHSALEVNVQGAVNVREPSYPEYPRLERTGRREMKLEIGDRVAAESESTERAPRTGTVAERLGKGSSARYRIRWDDGHESIYTPAAGALHRLHDAEREASGESR
jgi:Domain of unknown function (DUF1918)